MWLPDNVIVWRSDDGFFIFQTKPNRFQIFTFYGHYSGRKKWTEWKNFSGTNNDRCTYKKWPAEENIARHKNRLEKKLSKLMDSNLTYLFFRIVTSIKIPSHLYVFKNLEINDLVILVYVL